MNLGNEISVMENKQKPIEDLDLFLNIYLKLDSKYNVHKDDSYEYLVNFSQTTNKPIHRWFYYKEGYSPELVTNVLNRLNKIRKNMIIFDPFAGSGTTLLAAKQLGIQSSGFEINPFSSFMIKAKTRNYNKNDIKPLIEFNMPDYINIPDVYEKYELKIIQNLFDKEKLEKIELLKQQIKKIENEKSRNLLFAALFSILEDVSNYRKTGNGLKKKKLIKNKDPFNEFKKKLSEILEDLKDINNDRPEPYIINDSCLNMQNYKIDEIGISIFSPPYANCFDPFEVYKMELWVGEFVKSYGELKIQRKKALVSNLNADLNKEFQKSYRTDLITNILDFLSKQDLWDKRIPKMLDTYFYEIYNLLKILYYKTEKDGACVIVIGNSAYGNLAIPTDLIFAQLGEKAGFKVKEIIVARKNETSSQQHSKLGNLIEYLRESIVVLEKCETI